MGYKLITAPTDEPITLAEAKTQCRIDSTDEDAYLNGVLIPAARRWCEKYSRRVYLPQTWELYLDAWPSQAAIEIPQPPLQSITSFTYTDEDGSETILDSSRYLVDTASVPGWLVLRSQYTWPSVTLQDINGIAIRFVAGYASAADVPASIKLAILLLVGHWFENREGVFTGTVSRAIEFGVKALLDFERVF